MSVLIEGMTMPANCQECIALKIGDICFCGKKVATEEWNGTNRPDWCPLIECNECKDAVSRKAVKELIQNDFPQRGIRKWLSDALNDVDKLPPVRTKYNN